MTASVLVLFLVSIWALPSLHASLNPPPADLGGEKRDFSETARRTQWFSEAGYGVMVHYLADSEVSMVRPDDIHSDNTRRDWNACVEAFDVASIRVDEPAKVKRLTIRDCKVINRMDKPLPFLDVRGKAETATVENNIFVAAPGENIQTEMSVKGLAD